jgi:hypothetical protein
MLLRVVDLTQIQHCAAYDEALKGVDLLLMPTLPLRATLTSLAILPRRFRQACRQGFPSA